MPKLICKQSILNAKNIGCDYVILDTAGRLHVDGEMMQEIQSIYKSTNPNETIFVVDGMTGQDAVKSAKLFSESLSLTGTVLTKMDGDSKGGAAISITEVTGVPIKFIGISEKLNGLEVFEPKRMADRILGFGDVISIVEKAQSLNTKTNERTMEKIISGKKFDLNDFMFQIKQLKKMGSINQITKMLPFANRKKINNVDIDDKSIIWMEAIIQSMTQAERMSPKIINGSRRKRIALGSGRPVQEVNRLLKEYHQLEILIKKMGRKSFSQMKKTASQFMTVN